MNSISLNVRSPYTLFTSIDQNAMQRERTVRLAGWNNILSDRTDSSCSYTHTGSEQETTGLDREKSRQLRSLIRALKQTSKQEQNPYAQNSGDWAKDFLELSSSSDDDKEEEPEKPVNYNYKEVATSIQRAKTSVSAAKAVLSARRKVLEVKRKIANGDGDPKELQLALTHAKRMEMVARKKKHHLELEEMVVNTQRRDEEQDKMEEASEDVKNAIVAAEEEKVAKQEDAIFEEREDMIDEAVESFEENHKEVTDEMLAKLNEMIAEFGEEELKELEESMEMLENMEIIDPHMSKEDLEDLKRKHRASENKAIVKADMDYLKDMIKYMVEKGGSMPAAAGTGTAASQLTLPAGIEAVSPQLTVPDGGSIDIQV